MEEQNEFEKFIKFFTNRSTLERAQSISDDRIRILKLDKKIGLVEAEVQGNIIIPYKLNINISQKSFTNVIYHDCPDYLARKKLKNKFCKHIVKLISLLREANPNFAINLLKELHGKISTQTQVREQISPDMKQFLNKDLESQLEFEYMGFEFFFNILEVNNSARICLKEILMEAKKLPASLRGFHGGYEGGLFDHILLVTNYAYKLCKSMQYQVNIKKALLTAIYHDFGKISYYSYKKKHVHSYVILDREDLDKIHRTIEKNYRYYGRDYHVEETLAVLKRNDKILFTDDDISKAIIFHHGQWSKYHPIEMSELATLVHKADMIASQTHFV